ncbi:MAG: DUF5615 family PIN-like protein [Acidobacteria bacterium]|nr:DUF5615 family PIN-like protein [Acidobacteriota bacterium]
MLRFLTDQNFDQDISRGLIARAPNLDIITAFIAGVSGYEDPDLLRWTAEHDRILITHDKKTIPHYVKELVSDGLTLPGVILVIKSISIGGLIDDLEVTILCGRAEDFRNDVFYLPFRS